MAKYEFCCFRCFTYFETDEDQFGRVLCPSCREVERRPLTPGVRR